MLKVALPVWLVELLSFPLLLSVLPFWDFAAEPCESSKSLWLSKIQNRLARTPPAAKEVETGLLDALNAVDDS